MVTDEFKEKIDPYHLKHCTIPLYLLWFGGTWERIVKAVKTCLYKTRGRVDIFGLLAILSDVQWAINSCPLTYRSSDDLGVDILISNSLNANVSQGLIIRLDNKDLDATEPLSRTNLPQTLWFCEESLEKFSKIWHENYLLSLR